MSYGSIQDGCQSRIALRAPIGAETTHYFAMKNGRTQGAFAGIVVGRYIGAVQEDE